MKKLIILFTLFFFNTAVVQAAEDAQHRTQTTEADVAPTEGVLKKVNKVQNTIIIQHETIKNLDMPPMTMLFNVEDPSMIHGLKAGDHVQFKAIESHGALVVTWIRVQ
jgi:Cu/Ag efflux protein CusF